MTGRLASHSLHYACLGTVGGKPVLTGEFAHLAQWGIGNLPGRFPGLKVLRSRVEPAQVRLLLDFQRLDEDLLRVLQSYKSEVKNLLRRRGFPEAHLWQWTHEEQWISTPGELAGAEALFHPPVG
ncbi:MAG TPA: hypothetical protein VFR02_00390 [bacterium]|nr:hypothetical protein [bacterium]